MKRSGEKSDIMQWDGEEVVKQGSAKLQRGIGMVAGQLTLTNSRLLFEPRQARYQGELVIVKLSHIVAMHKKWTRYLNRVPFFPHTLSIVTENGKEYRFVLFRRSLWAKRIHAQKIVD